MITLKTLPTATAQEVFDQVSRHLLKQNAKSEIADEDCRYRHEDKKCAAGCLIGDNEYNPEIEGSRWCNIELPCFSNNHMSLIGKLQRIHDVKDVCSWKEELKRLAASENLKWNL